MNPMQILISLLQTLRDWLWSEYSLDIALHDETTLQIQAGSRLIEFTLRSRSVWKASRRLARFHDIRSIDLTHYAATSDRPEYWKVSLKLNGWFRSVLIGKSLSDVDASIAAARISAVTGKPVRSL
ncbi:hypothetical protein [Chitinilyticum piscinae]|uniref:Uncharacterized protein n=1 Tax=Chitinilyticum piscinae TaxID=2866724 RepID=A0A8J7FMT8_9NEIS|nr:hypothetical protein [Chitinilyticum piscinae]MBE9610425.1 hypothetical protein [Chitinilyticum piscinae]